LENVFRKATVDEIDPGCQVMSTGHRDEPHDGEIRLTNNRLFRLVLFEKI